MFARKLRENLHLIAVLVSLCLTLIAQYLFTGEILTHSLDSDTWFWKPIYSLALVILLFAIGCATWALFPQAGAEADGAAISQKANRPDIKRIWFIISGGCYILSIILYLSAGENTLVDLLWVAGIGFLVTPLWLQIRGKSTKDQIPTWEWVLAGFISIIGFGLRYWNLTEIPSHIDNDVALMGKFALELINSSQYNWIGSSGSGHLLSYDQFLAWSMRLFGGNHYGIVMHSVVLGTLSLILIFWLGRELGGRFLGFIAIGLLTISYTHIHFSRILFGSSASFFAILAIYMFFRGLRTNEPLWFAIAGVAVGWGVLLYDSSRVIPVIIVTVIVWQALWQHQSLRFIWENWKILLIGAVLGFGPVLAYTVRDFFAFSGRANSVLLWTPVVWTHELATYVTSSPIVVLWQQTWRTFLTLYLTGDGSPHFAFPRPMVDPLTASLFILGLGYCLSRIKDIKYFTVLAWIFLTFVLGGVLTADPPYWPHLNIALPAIVLMAAMGAKGLADKITTATGQVGYKIYCWILVGVVIVTGISNWQIYYNYVQNNAGPRIRISRYLSSLPSDFKVYLVSPDWNWNEFAFGFFNREMMGQDLMPGTLVTTPPEIQPPTVFILVRHPDLVPVLERLYPGGVLENHYDYNNLVSFISYRIVPPGYNFKPVIRDINPLQLPGWWLIFGIFISCAGRIIFLYYKNRHQKVLEVDGPSGM